MEYIYKVSGGYIYTAARVEDQNGLYTYTDLTSSPGSEIEDVDILYVTAIYAGGRVNDATIYNSGQLQLYTDAYASNTAVSGGSLYIDGGFATNTVLEGADLSIFSGIAIDVTVSGDGFVEVLSAGVASGTDINGGFDSSTYSYFGGMAVSSGGTAVNTTITCGYEYVYQGGTVTSTIIEPNGEQILSGGSATSTILDGFQCLSGGSTATNTTIVSGAQLIVSGTSIDTTVVDGEQGLLDGSTTGTILDNRTCQQVTGGTATSTTVNSGAWLYVDGGTVSSAILKDGGGLWLEEDPSSILGSGIQISNLVISSSGYIWLMDAKYDSKGSYEVISSGSGGDFTLVVNENGSSYSIGLSSQSTNDSFILSECDTNGGASTLTGHGIKIIVSNPQLKVNINAMAEGSDASLTISLATPVAADEQIQLSVSAGTADLDEITDLPAAATIAAGHTSVTVPFHIAQNPYATNDSETFTVTARSPNAEASATGSIKEFVSNPFAFTAADGEFTYNSDNNQMDGSGEIDVGLTTDKGSNLVTIKDATATYDDSEFVVSGTVFATLGGVADPLFDGSFVLPYSDISTSMLTDDGPFEGKFELAGLNVRFEQLTFESDALFAAISFSLDFTTGSIEIDTASLGVNDGLEFTNAGPQLVFGTGVALPDTGPVNVFGLFTGSLTKASMSYVASKDTLFLQGVFTATNIFSSSLTAKVDFAGDNYIQYHDGDPDFIGSLSMTGFSSATQSDKSGFGLKEVDLTVNTIAKTLSGEVDFTLPFGGRAPKGDVKLVGSWADGPKVTEVDIAFSNLGIVIPETPDLIWQSASISVANMFQDSAPTTFSGSLGFSFGPNIGGAYIGTLTLSGSASSQQLTGTEQIQIVPYNFVKQIAGGSLSGLQSIFPIFGSSGTVTAKFGGANSGFQSFSFKGTTQILGNFITLTQSFQADANLDFTLAGQADINFGNAIFHKILGFDTQETANYLVSYTNGAALSNDFAEAWFTTKVDFLSFSANVTIGVKATFDGTTSLLLSAPASTAVAITGSHKSTDISMADQTAKLSASGTSTPALSTIPLFLTVAWTNASAQPPSLTVTTPNGQAIQQADFSANNISIVSALTTAYSETLAVLNPSATSGWNVEVKNSTGLGTISVSTTLADTPPSLQNLALAGVNPDGTLSLQYNVTNTNSKSTVSFFVDQDGKNFDGVLLGSTAATSNGTGNFKVSLNALNNGIWHIYGLISDGTGIPQEIYAAATLSIAGNIFTQKNSDGSSIVSSINIVGEPYNSTITKYDALSNLISETFYNSNQSVYFLYTGTVNYANFLKYKTALNNIPGGVAIADTASNIISGLAVLAADAVNIKSITVTGASVTVSVATYKSDKAALDKVVGGFAISDTLANVTAALATLAGDSRITTITVSGGAPSVSVATYKSDKAALDKVVGGFAIADALANVTAALASLAADSRITTITVSGGAPSVSVATYTADKAALDKVGGGFAISDTLANVTAALATLAADSHITTVTVTGGALSVSVTTYKADKAALDKVVGGFAVADTAAGISAKLDALEVDVSKISSVKFTDTTPPVLNLTQAQATSDASLLSKITSSYVLNVSNTNGTITTIGHGSGLGIIAISGQDNITGNGGGDTFIFNPNFGKATITDFYRHLATPSQDVVSLPAAEFANFATLLSNTSQTGTGLAVITASNGDQLTLPNMTVALLKTYRNDFQFHT